jgi:hypothetical protein
MVYVRFDLRRLGHRVIVLSGLVQLVNSSCTTFQWKQGIEELIRRVAELQEPSIEAGARDVPQTSVIDGNRAVALSVDLPQILCRIRP